MLQPFVPMCKPMSLKNEFIHPQLGKVRVAVNRRARRIIMRVADGCINVTVPLYAMDKDVEKALARHGDRLKEMLSVKSDRIDAQYTAGAGSFRIKLQVYAGSEFMWVHNGAIATLMCPDGTDYELKQEWLRRVIANVVAEEAKKVLPARLSMLAERYGCKYKNCSVRNSHSRWGSCSGKGNISLSIYLVLLPDELVDYVLLHELCHTIEMNHGERFWTLLDEACGGDAKKIRAELKKYSPEI